MASITEQIKELRTTTGAGVLDCRNALQQCEGDFEKAAQFLRNKGLAAAEKKAERVANQGLIGSYVHTGSRMAAVVELNCESDFVALTPEFQELAHDLAMQVVATKPRWVRPEDVPADVLDIEKESFRRQALDEGKVERVVDRIIEGRLDKFYSQFCLLRQPFIRDNDVIIEDLVKAKIAQFGENIVIKRFARLEVGETL
ncbi:MAG: translation elongation factor Ts [Anaerolineae bacterium]